MKNNDQITKKQHYVPRCYLEAWTVSPKHQIYVFDKEAKKPRKNNIYDVASENKFYDIDIEKLKEAFYKNREFPFEKSSPQFLEHMFSESIEGPYSVILKKIIQKADSVTPWIAENCFFISSETKLELSLYIALQFLRTKQIRNNIIDAADCMEQLLSDLNASDDIFSKYTIKNDEARLVHANMLIEPNDVLKVCNRFYEKAWILGINQTSNSFYTSDNPIFAHNNMPSPYFSNNGLGSPGVEIFFPISPHCILIMDDYSKYGRFKLLDRRYMLINDSEDVVFYNQLCAAYSSRCVFSQDGNFSVIDNILKNNPRAFENNSVKIEYGGKTYLPRK